MILLPVARTACVSKCWEWIVHIRRRRFRGKWNAILSYTMLDCRILSNICPAFTGVRQSASTIEMKINKTWWSLLFARIVSCPNSAHNFLRTERTKALDALRNSLRQVSSCEREGRDGWGNIEISEERRGARREENWMTIPATSLSLFREHKPQTCYQQLILAETLEDNRWT